MKKSKEIEKIKEELETDTEIEDEVEESSIKRILKELIPYVIIFVVVIVVRTFLVTPILVNGPSMNPTLDGGELMLLNKLGKIDRFDIVVVDIGDEDIIKRVIALPGESIACEGGIIYVNGRKQEEKYSEGSTYDFEKIVLKDNEYFVMGDNRENSADSRKFGPFTDKQIKGTTNLVLFPFNKIGTVE